MTGVPDELRQASAWPGATDSKGRGLVGLVVAVLVVVMGGSCRSSMKATRPTVIRMTPPVARGDAAAALEQALRQARQAGPGAGVELAGGTYTFSRGVKLT